MMNNTDSLNINENLANMTKYPIYEAIDKIYIDNLNNFDECIKASKMISIFQVVSIMLITGVLSLIILPIFSFN